MREVKIFNDLLEKENPKKKFINSETEVKRGLLISDLVTNDYACFYREWKPENNDQ